MNIRLEVNEIRQGDRFEYLGSSERGWSLRGDFVQKSEWADVNIWMRN